MEDDELARIRGTAEREGMSMADWVRQALKRALQDRALGDRDKKIAIIRAAAGHEFPTTDVGQMLAEIGAGRDSGLP